MLTFKMRPLQRFLHLTFDFMIHIIILFMQKIFRTSTFYLAFNSNVMFHSVASVQMLRKGRGHLGIVSWHVNKTNSLCFKVMLPLRSSFTLILRELNQLLNIALFMTRVSRFLRQGSKCQLELCSKF